MALEATGGGEGPPESGASSDSHEKPPHCQGTLENGDACTGTHLMRFWQIPQQWLCAKCAKSMGLIGDVLS